MAEALGGRSSGYPGTLLCLAEVLKPLRSSSDSERSQVAASCLDFALRSPVATSPLTPTQNHETLALSSGNFEAVTVPFHAKLPPRPPVKKGSPSSGGWPSLCHEASVDISSSHTMIPVKGEVFISSRSSLQNVDVAVNLSENSIELTHGSILICQHPFLQLGVLQVLDSLNDMVVYIGRDLCHQRRIAVVLQMTSSNMARHLVNDYHSLNKSRKQSRPSSSSTMDSAHSGSTSTRSDSPESISPLSAFVSSFPTEKEFVFTPTSQAEFPPHILNILPIPPPQIVKPTVNPMEHTYEIIYPHDLQSTMNKDVSETAEPSLRQVVSDSIQVPDYDLSPPQLVKTKYSDSQLPSSTSTYQNISLDHSLLPIASTEIETPNIELQNLSLAQPRVVPCSRSNSNAKLARFFGSNSIEKIEKNQCIATTPPETMTPEKSVSKHREAEMKQHIENFLKEESKYLHNLHQLIFIVKNHTDHPKGKLACAQLEHLSTIHEQVNVFLNKDQLTPQQISQIFLEKIEGLAIYVDLIRTCSSAKNMEFKFKDEQVNEIEKNLQFVRIRPNHYSQTFLSWLAFTDLEEEKEVLNEAIDAMNKISRKADSWLLIDSVRKSPYRLIDLMPLILYSVVTVSGPGFRSNQQFTLLLFNDVLLFTTAIANDINKCFDALRMEYLRSARKSKECQNSLDLIVDYGERRGRETLSIKFARQCDANKWNEHITRILSINAQKIKEINS